VRVSFLSLQAITTVCGTLHDLAALLFFYLSPLVTWTVFPFKTGCVVLSLLGVAHVVLGGRCTGIKAQFPVLLVTESRASKELCIYLQLIMPPPYI
jgi:hypothetical protein